MGGGFALSMNRKSGDRVWGAAEIAPTEAGEPEGPVPADCCTCPFGGRGDTSCVWPSGCLCPSVPHTRGDRGCTGAGIWLLMATVGAELCRAVYIPQPEH